jgi:hypothetical protein
MAMLVAGGVVLALALGSLGVAVAAPSTSTTGTAGGGLGLRLGATMRQAGATLADTVAKLTGQPVADVRAARSAGASFESIAAKKSVSASQLVEQTLAARKAALDTLVKSGRITQAQADAALANMKTRLTERVSATGATNCNGQGGGRGAGCGSGGGGCGMGGGGRGQGGGGCGGGGCGVAPTGSAQ